MSSSATGIATPSTAAADVKQSLHTAYIQWVRPKLSGLDSSLDIVPTVPETDCLYHQVGTTFQEAYEKCVRWLVKELMYVGKHPVVDPPPVIAQGLTGVAALSPVVGSTPTQLVYLHAVRTNNATSFEQFHFQLTPFGTALSSSHKSICMIGKHGANLEEASAACLKWFRTEIERLSDREFDDLNTTVPDTVATVVPSIDGTTWYHRSLLLQPGVEMNVPFETRPPANVWVVASDGTSRVDVKSSDWFTLAIKPCSVSVNTSSTIAATPANATDVVTPLPVRLSSKVQAKSPVVFVLTKYSYLSNTPVKTLQTQLFQEPECRSFMSAPKDTYIRLTVTMKADPAVSAALNILYE